MVKKAGRDKQPQSPSKAPPITVLSLMNQGYSMPQAMAIIANNKVVTPSKPAAPTRAERRQQEKRQEALLRQMSEPLERKPFEIEDEALTRTIFYERMKSWANELSNMGQRLSPLDRAVIAGPGMRTHSLIERVQAIANKNPNIKDIQRIETAAEFCKREASYQDLWLEFENEIQHAYEALAPNSAEFILDSHLPETYHQKILNHIVDTLQNTLKLDPRSLEHYKQLFEKLFLDLFTVFAGNLKDETVQSEISIYKYALSDLFANVSIKVLCKQGVNFLWYYTDADTPPEPLLSHLVDNFKGEQRRVGGLIIPVNYQLDLGLNVPKEIVICMGGNLYVNLTTLEWTTIHCFKNAQKMRDDFEKLFKSQPQFSFVSDPEKVVPFLMANSLNVGEQEDSLRATIKENALLKAEAELATRAFIETKYQAEDGSIDDQLNYWLNTVASQEDELKQRLLLDQSIVKQAYESFMTDHSYEVTGTTNNADLVILNKRMLTLEGRLRQLMKSNNPASLLLEGMAGTIFPYDSDSNSTPKVTGNKKLVFDDIDKVLFTRLLTEKLLGDEGREVSKLVAWDKLYCANENKIGREASFDTQWKEYFSNPTEYIQHGKDPDGLMRLRAAWYKFFDETMGRFDKYQQYVQTRSINRVAEEIWQENFLSYSGRDRHYQNIGNQTGLHDCKSNIGIDWKKVYRERLAFE